MSDITPEASQQSKKSLKNAILTIMITVSSVISLVVIALVAAVYIQISDIKRELSLINKAQGDSAYGVGTDDNLLTDGTEEINGVDAADILEIAELENRAVWDLKENNNGVSGGSNASYDSDSGIRRVYLTFDDGPSSNTDRILDILEQYGVKATFFVVGKEGFNSQYKRIVEDGHTLGMHSYSHIYRDIYSSKEAYSEDLMKLRDYLYEITGVECDKVRFPGGSSNTLSKVPMSELAEYLDSIGISYYDWNVTSGDAAGRYVSAAQIANNVLSNVNKYNNVIVLFHDAAGKNSTVEALPVIIETLLASENTVLLPVTDTTVQVHHVH